MAKTLRETMPGLFPPASAPTAAPAPVPPRKAPQPRVQPDPARHGASTEGPRTIAEKLAYRRPPEDTTHWKSACCPHSEKDHCKGGDTHHEYQPRTLGPPLMTFTCPTRHCTAVLCCCTCYQPKEATNDRHPA